MIKLSERHKVIVIVTVIAACVAVLWITKDGLNTLLAVFCAKWVIDRLGEEEKETEE